MPEYLYPGVYVEEIESGVHTVPGVSTSIDDPRMGSLISEFVRVARTNVPEWTNAESSDPGVTVIEVFAFLAENLMYRASQIPQRGHIAAMRAAAAMAALAQVSQPGCATLKRPLYFTGRLLDAATLSAEQEYHREKLRRHNRALLGYGVASGLGVHLEAAGGGSGSRIIIEPGCAIDRGGEELSLPCGASVATPEHGDSAFVTLRFWERACSSSATAEPSSPAISIVEEACIVGIHQDVFAPAIALARLLRSDGVWQLDPAFVVPRLHRVEWTMTSGAARSRE